MANQNQQNANAEQSVLGAELPLDTQVTLNGLPSLHAGGLQLAVVNNDFVIGFTRSVMGNAVLNGVNTPVARVIPVVDITVSPKTLKDMYLVLVEVIADYEKEWGTIETAYTRKKAAEASL